MEIAGSVMVSCRIVVPVTRVRFPASEFFFEFKTRLITFNYDKKALKYSFELIIENYNILFSFICFQFI